MNRKVFISYSKQDKDIADRICEELEKRWILCWIAPRNIDVGENWANQIVDAIEECTDYLVIISVNSIESNEVLKEITLASEMKKNIYAVCVNGCEPSKGFRYHLSIAQRLNLQKEKILEVIDRLEPKIKGEKRIVSDLPKKESNYGELQIVSYQELTCNRGMDKSEIARQLVENDRKLYPHIDDDNEGDVSQWETYLSKYPQTFRYMVNDQNQIVGNWSMVSISAEDYRRAKEGKLMESELNIGKTEYFMLGGIFYGYLLNMSINEEHMSPTNIRLLFESFLEQLEKFAEEDIYFRSWCVNVFLEDHERRYESLGFQYACDNQKSGKMYVIDLWPYPQNKIFQKRKKLKSLYERKFRVKCRQLKEEDYLDDDMLESVAGLIYDTDPYIYPALFETRENAIEIIPELIRRQDAMFCLNNLFVAEYEDDVVGILLWNRGNLGWSEELFREVSEELGIPISSYFEQVKEKYIDSYDCMEEDDISIINFCISEDVRNIGMGDVLIKKFLNQHKNDIIKLCVLEENPAAVKLYEKHGFREVSRYQGFSIEEMDLVCMGMERK